MTTILDTLGIATCQVSYGKEASFAGAFASASIVVYPKALGISQLRLTWAATGDMLTSFSDSTTADPGSPGIIVLPQTGQAGFRHGQSTFQDWYYEAIVTSTVNGQTASRTYRFQIPAGQTTLDLDALDEDGQVTAIPASAPILPEPAGLSNTTRASLSATSATLWKANTPYVAGQAVVSPSGFVVKALTSFTSGASYNAANWSDGVAAGYPTLGGDANIVRSPGSAVDVGPALQAAFDSGRAVCLVPGAAYLLKTPVFLDSSDNSARYSLNLNGAKLLLDPTLPAPTTWDTAIGTAPPTGFFSGTSRAGWTGGATVDTSATYGSSNAPFGTRLVIANGVVGSAGSLGSQAVGIIFGGTASNGNNGTANGLSQITTTNVLTGISWSGYADGNFVEECEIGSNPPGGSTRLIYQRSSGDKTRVSQCKAAGGLIDIGACTGFIIDGIVSGQVNLVNSTGQISTGHQEADEFSSAVPWSVSIDRSHVTILDLFSQQSNVAGHYNVRVNDSATAPNFVASEVVIKGWRTSARYQASSGDAARGAALYITALNKSGYVRVENSRGIVAVSGSSVGYQALPVDSADATIQAAFAAGQDYLVTGNWHLAYNGTWNVGPVADALPAQRRMSSPTLAVASDPLITAGGLTSGQLYEYVVATKTGSGGYSALPSAVQVTASSGKAVDLTITNTSGACTIAIWRKAGVGVTSTPDRYIEIGLSAYQSTWVDTGTYVNGRAWQTASLPVPSAVASTGCQYVFPRVVRKAAAQVVANTTVMVNDTELAFPLAANTEYAIEVFAVFDATTTGDAKFAFTVPTGASLTVSQISPSTGSSANSGSVSYAAGSTSGTQPANSGGSGIGLKTGYWARGSVKTGSTAGTLQFQYAQTTAEATNLTVYDGSILTVTKAG